MRIEGNKIIGVTNTGIILYIMDRDGCWTGDSVRYPWCYYISKRDKRKILLERGYDPKSYYLEEAGVEITTTEIPLDKAMQLATKKVETQITI